MDDKMAKTTVFLFGLIAVALLILSVWRRINL